MENVWWKNKSNRSSANAKYFLTSIALASLYAISVLWWPTSVHAAGCDESNVRWAASSNRLYVSGEGVVCTIPEISEAQPHANIVQDGADEAVWFLGSNIVLQNGARLNVHGPLVRELRLKSNNDLSDPNRNVYIRAHWGTVDISDTVIRSWDEVTGAPDMQYGADGRAYIQARSYLGGDGEVYESRMDIRNSDIGYLGYHGAEAYGLSWKVLGKTAGIYDAVDVFGDITNSHIHHNYFGTYTFGLYGGQWIGNEVNNNVVYGFDPHDDSDSLLIEDNDVYGNGSHGIICSQRCDSLVIRNNRSYQNGGNGIMLHRNTNDSEVYANELTDNGDSGIALFESHRNRIYGNNVVGNSKGIRLSVGSRENIVEDNVFDQSTKYGIYSYQGSDLPVEGDGRPASNQFINNTISNSGYNGLKLKQADNNLFSGNVFDNNGKDLWFYDAHENEFTDNQVAGNASYGVRLSNGSSKNEIKANKISANGKIGIYLMSDKGGNIISDNEVSGGSEYGIKVNNSSDNIIEANVLEVNRRGLEVKGTSHNNLLAANIIRDNAQYAVYVEGATDNEFVTNITSGNGSNYYYAKGGAVNVIKNTPELSAKAREDGSAWRIVNDGSVLVVNSEELPTVIEAGLATVNLDGNIESGIVRFAEGDFVAAVGSGQVEIVVDRDAGENGAPIDQWEARSVSGAAAAVNYAIGGFTPGAEYDVEIENDFEQAVAANSDGKLIFTSQVADSDLVEYEIK